MKRHHFIELHDCSGCPDSLRAAFQEFLAYFANASGVFEPVAPMLSAILRKTGVRTIVDLCSGAGGPWPALAGKLVGVGAVQVLLTDKHPPREALTFDARLVQNNSRNAAGKGLPALPGREIGKAASRRSCALGTSGLAAVKGVIQETPCTNAGLNSPGENGLPDCTYSEKPVDALALPMDMQGVCTLFSSFHHFEPAVARSLLQGLVRNGVGVGVFEATVRSPISALLLFLMAPFFVLLLTPWIRPFRWSRLFWTYCVPAVPFMMGFDGMISCFRTYTPEEMRTLAAGLGDGAYTWESGRIPARGLPASITYLIGLPAK